jgi:hypothetical protein
MYQGSKGYTTPLEGQGAASGSDSIAARVEVPALTVKTFVPFFVIFLTFSAINI